VTAHEQEAHALLARIDGLQVAVAALEKQVGRAGREQLKANALAETHAERLTEALAALRAVEDRHEAELRAAHEQTQEAVVEARLAMARAIFPALDGLDEALRAGQATLAHAARPEAPDDLLRRLLFDAAPAAPPDPLRVALAAWLDGLTMVRRRLLDTLVAEGVTPIAAEGQPFDPRLHLAVEVVSNAAPPGTVVAVVRRGFVAGTRILRHAEVSVAADR
jgi:molecular chaperone GrpE